MRKGLDLQAAAHAATAARCEGGTWDRCSGSPVVWGQFTVIGNYANHNGDYILAKPTIRPDNGRMEGKSGKAFGFSEGAHVISAFRAFVSDDGMPGVRLTKESGEYLDVIFSVPATQELQRQLSHAIEMANSFPQSKQ